MEVLIQTALSKIKSVNFETYFCFLDILKSDTWTLPLFGWVSRLQINFRMCLLQAIDFKLFSIENVSKNLHFKPSTNQWRLPLNTQSTNYISLKSNKTVIILIIIFTSKAAFYLNHQNTATSFITF